MSNAERYRGFADKIAHETDKFSFASSKRMKRAKDPKAWLRLQQIASKRFVLKMVRIIEEFEGGDDEVSLRVTRHVR